MPSVTTRLDHIRVLREVIKRGLSTKTELTHATGWARNTVAQRLTELIDAGWVVETNGVAKPGFGRPSAYYAVSNSKALIFVADFGQDQLVASLMTMRGGCVATQTRSIVLATGPELIARTAADTLDGLCAASMTNPLNVVVAVVGMASPIDNRKRAVNPVSAPGWFDVSLPEVFGKSLQMPVIPENDANLMAVGAARQFGDESTVIYVKIAKGIGAGTVIAGQLQRGINGLAGELGHTPVSNASGIPCTCGSEGCLGCVASVDALVAAATAAGLPITTFDEFERYAKESNPMVLALIRQAGRDVGEALLAVATVLAPEAIIFGGRLSLLGEHLLAGVKEVLYARMLPSLSAGLDVRSSSDHHGDARCGAISIGSDYILERMIAMPL